MIFFVSGAGVGDTPERKKNVFQFPLRLIAETMFSHKKKLIGTFFLEENILGINKGIFKLFNSLTKKCF